jgi:hypothetical protein
MHGDACRLSVYRPIAEPAQGLDVPVSGFADSQEAVLAHAA